MYKVKVYVTLRKSVLDPHGNAVKKQMQMNGIDGIKDVRIGKYIELTFNKDTENLENKIKEVCENLLVNPVTEDYRYEIEECAAQ